MVFSAQFEGRNVLEMAARVPWKCALGRVYEICGRGFAIYEFRMWYYRVRNESPLSIIQFVMPIHLHDVFVRPSHFTTNVAEETHQFVFFSLHGVQRALNPPGSRLDQHNRREVRPKRICHTRVSFVVVDP